MRTLARLMTGAALTATSLGLAAAGTTSASAVARDLRAPQIRPATAAPGSRIIGDTEACGPESSGTGNTGTPGATELPLTTASGGENVAGRVQAPADAQPGTEGIDMACKNGKDATGDLPVGGGT